MVDDRFGPSSRHERVLGRGRRLDDVVDDELQLHFIAIVQIRVG